MLGKLFQLVYPPKCVLCECVLDENTTDLCHECRKNAPEFSHAKRNIPFVAHWTSLWYYKGDVRNSIHRFKFYNRRKYAETYARLLAIRLEKDELTDWDLMTWIPISPVRCFFRGYDQSELICKALKAETGKQGCRLLKKTRNTPAQSGIPDAARRRANVLGAYRVPDQSALTGKRILLLDDVITTGATASECARTLLTAGAASVTLATVAAARQDKK